MRSDFSLDYNNNGIIHILNRTMNHTFGDIRSRFDPSRSSPFTFIFQLIYWTIFEVFYI